MIVSNGLGTTATDLTIDASNGAYSALPSDLVYGLTSNDATAWFIALGGAWLLWKVLTKTKRVASNIKAPTTILKEHRTKRIRGKIKKLEESL